MTNAKKFWLLLVGGVLSAASFSLHADNAPPSAAEVQIPFADRNIRNWQVVDDKTLLIQDNSRKWYKATLFGTCINLSFAEERLGFDSSPGGTFDKFSAILVRGQRCPLSSLVETTAPPKKSKVKKPEPTAAPQ
jgi:hypothetical protein